VLEVLQALLQLSLLVLVQVAARLLAQHPEVLDEHARAVEVHAPRARQRVLEQAQRDHGLEREARGEEAEVPARQRRLAGLALGRHA